MEGKTCYNGLNCESKSTAGNEQVQVASKISENEEGL